MNLFAILGLGLLLGLRHAADADHVVAVTAIAGRTRRVPATVREPLWGCAYLVDFGLGTLLGMTLVTTGFVLPVASAAQRRGGATRVINVTTGALSVAFGLWMAWQIGFGDGLLLAGARWAGH